MRMPLAIRTFGLKGRLFAVTAGLTALVTGGLYVYSERALEQFFATERALAEVRMAEAMDALYGEWRQKTEQIAAALVSNPILAAAIASSDREVIAGILQKQAPVLHFDAGVESVQAFDFRGRLLAGWNEPPPSVQLTEALKAVAHSYKPMSFVKCVTLKCSHYTVVPVLGTRRENAGLLVLAFEMTDMLFGFHAVSGAELHLVGPGPAVRPSNSGQALQTQKFRLPDGYSLVAVFDTQSELSAIAAVQRRFLILGAVTLIVLEALTWLALWSPLTRLRKVADNLPLLATRRYSDIRTQLRAPERLKDEIDEVTNTVIAVSHQLERLLETEAKATRESSQRELAERYSAAKSAFLAEINHELRTPLNNVVGLSQILITHTATAHPPRFYLEKIEASAKTVLGIVEQVLDISRIEAGHAVAEQSSFELRPLLKDVLDVVYVGACDKGLVLDVECGEQIPTTAIGDPGRLRQVLVNLCANAVKFTNSGRITLRALPVDGTAKVRFEVDDTGPGISPEHLQKIFEAYNRGDVEVSRHQPGYGLGMLIAKTLVSLMGGALSVRSTVGVGTCFYFELPLPAASATDSGTTPQATFSLNGYRALVAEDDEVSRLVINGILSAQGCDVTTVADGAAAIARLRQSSFDVVILDLEMPRHTGLEVIEASAKHHPTRAFIVLTGDATAATREACLGAGARAFLAKPVDACVLVGTVHEIVSRTAAGRPVVGEDRTPVLDELQLTALFNLGPDVAAQVTEAFCTTAPQVLAELLVAGAEGDAAEVRRLLHKLKGSALGVGANALANYCHALQQSVDPIASGLAELEQHVEAVMEPLKRVSSA